MAPDQVKNVKQRIGIFMCKENFQERGLKCLAASLTYNKIKCQVSGCKVDSKFS